MNIRNILIGAALLLSSAMQAQDPVRLEYFFDTDPGYGKGLELTMPQTGEKTYEMSFESLTPGYHLLSLRAQDDKGHWSTVLSRPIYARPVLKAMPVKRIEYFFDNDPGYGKGFVLDQPKEGENTYEMSFESLTPGYHLMSLRAQDEYGRWSSVMSRPIFVINPQKVEALEYFIDEDPGVGKAVAVTLPENLSDAFAFEVVTEQLEPGEHKLYVRAKGTDGIWTYLSSKSFTFFIGKAGDVNGDGHVTKADVEAVANHIMGQTPDDFNKKNANVNGDDKIDAADIVEIVNKIE